MNILVMDGERSRQDELKMLIAQVCPEADVYDVEAPSALLELARKLPCEAAFLGVPVRNEDAVAKTMELGRKLRRLIPRMNLIFVADNEDYTRQAMELHASGYLCCPLLPEKVAAELSDLRYQPRLSSEVLLRIRCFGNFDVFLPDGQPVYFSRSKAKEAFAYLVHLRGTACTTRELAAVLFEDQPYDLQQQQYVQKILYSMGQTLKKYGAGEVVIKRYNSYALDVSRVDCDSYRLTWAGQEDDTGRDEYMLSYSWAEYFPGGYGRWNES